MLANIFEPQDCNSGLFAAALPHTVCPAAAVFSFGACLERLADIEGECGIYVLHVVLLDV
jgi:hypothetical protein